MTDTDKSQTSTLFWKKGQMLIELLIAIGLLGIFLPVLLTSYLTNTEGKVLREQRLTAHHLTVEATEALRIIRESGWDAVATNGTFHPQSTGTNWTLSNGSENIGLFTRSISIAEVYRDASGNIVTSGGTADPSTKEVTISISWSQPSTQLMETTFYLTRYLDNLVFSETTEADFLQGTNSGTAVTNNAGGEIVLGGGGSGDWCLPNDSIVAQLDLDQSAKAHVVSAREGKAFTGTDYGNQGYFTEIDIDQSDPPNLSIASTLTGYDTNDVFIDDTHAYIATDDTDKDIVIVDLATNQEVGYFDGDNSWRGFSWWGTARGVYVIGNVGYASIGTNLVTFDLSQKTGSRPQLDTINLSTLWWFPATGYRLMVVGEYAYVAIDFGSSEMRIIDVSDPSNLSVAGNANVNGNRGVDIFVNETGTRAYLATTKSNSKDELFIINTETKTGSLPILGSYDTDGMDPKDVSVVTDNKLIIAGTGGEEYQVVDISNDASPNRCGGLEVDEGVYGVSGILESDGDAFAYIVTKDPNNEFKVIEGGPGESFSSSGWFESSAFVSPTDAAFNYTSASFTIPTQTAANYQIAITDPVNNDCDQATYTFLGPDGTGSTFFTSDGQIHLDNDGAGYENPAKCLKYKVYLETIDTAFSPVFEDITINYSP